ncbi:uncharacterized protein PV07_08578 [Cladophialophora immunda]|uniref:Uncharacterized protein n=1 Tax=Cladophialophora immunda TaxID=569365 RepID=A0A0D1ZCD6_9EURO|nr:uncharacterized protein PV07_08578 [Cladophialophora immunda]KIW25401.1 hypothetical protein PV07_08578 [Cladophialophora immunda]
MKGACCTPSPGAHFNLGKMNECICRPAGGNRLLNALHGCFLRLDTFVLAALQSSRVLRTAEVAPGFRKRWPLHPGRSTSPITNTLCKLHRDRVELRTTQRPVWMLVSSFHSSLWSSGSLCGLKRATSTQL